MPNRVRDRFVQAIATMATPGPRMLDEVACVASVMMAIALAHLLGARMVSWAAFTAFVLMKGELPAVLVRGVLRILGTALGAGLALLIVPLLIKSLVGAMVFAAVVGAAGLYGTLTARRGYGWLLFGLTFEMILLDKLEHPALDTLAFARTRLVEVVAGTIACVAISLISTVIARRFWPSSSPPSQTAVGWHPNAARHAVQAGLALGLLPLLQHLFALPELPQAGITIMAVMIVPVAGLGASGLGPVSQRIFHRAIGCLAGGGLAASILLLAQGNPVILVAGTCLGIVIGRHIENGYARITYLGLQFTLAILVTLVPDNYGDAAIGPAIERLASIFIGMALLGPVLVAWHLFAKDGRGASGQADPAISE